MSFLIKPREALTVIPRVLILKSPPLVKTMRCMFWNVRGLGTAHRRGLVLKHVIQENLDIVGIQETIKQEFSDQELKDMSGTVDFVWKWIPAKGHSGGLLLGVKLESFEIEQVELAGYFLGCLVRNRLTNFRF